MASRLAQQRRPLTRDRIVDAGIRVADREGLGAVTMRRLAEELGVHPTSAYNHLSSKEAILDAIAEALFVEAALPATYADWREWVRTFAAAMRSLAANHPGAFLVLTVRPAEGPAASTQTEGALDAFRRGGFPPADARDAVVGVALAVLGMALNECPRTGQWVEPDLSHLSRAAYPRLFEAADAGGADSAPMWDLVVGALISGLESAASA